MFLLYVLPWAISVARWSIFLFVKALPALLCPRRNTPLAGETMALSDTTIVVPTLDPETDLFRAAYRTWDRSGVGEILVVAPARAGAELEDLVRSTGPTTAYRVLAEPSKGKRAALLHGAREARTSVVIFVDDDTLFRSRTLRALVDAFRDPSVGGAGVGQRVSPRDPRRRYTHTEIVCDLRLEMRYVEVAGVAALANGYCSCLSGRCAAYRRSVLMRPAFAETFLCERFLGALQLSGDDKFVTRFVSAQPDYTTTTDVAEEARVETRFKDGYALVKQLVRWSRNSWRSDLKSLASPVLWREATVLQFHLLDRMVTPLFVLLGPTLVAYSAFATGDPYYVAGWCAWVTLTRVAKALPYFLRHPSHLRAIPLYMLYCYGSILLKFYALATLRNTSWLTRNVTTRDGHVVSRRSAPAATRTTTAKYSSSSSSSSSSDDDDVVDSEEGSYDGGEEEKETDPYAAYPAYPAIRAYPPPTEDDDDDDAVGYETKTGDGGEAATPHHPPPPPPPPRNAVGLELAPLPPATPVSTPVPRTVPEVTTATTTATATDGTDNDDDDDPSSSEMIVLDTAKPTATTTTTSLPAPDTPPSPCSTPSPPPSALLSPQSPHVIGPVPGGVGVQRLAL